jgi:hypothetical protein
MDDAILHGKPLGISLMSMSLELGCDNRLQLRHLNSDKIYTSAAIP